MPRDWTLELKGAMRGPTDAGKSRDVVLRRSVCMTTQSSPATPRTLLVMIEWSSSRAVRYQTTGTDPTDRDLRSFD